VAYADAHCMLACVAAGDAETLGRRSSEIQRIADSRYLFVDDHKGWSGKA